MEKKLANYENFDFNGDLAWFEYKNFERLYIRYIKDLCKKYNWKAVNIGKGYYEFFVIIKNHVNYLLLSIKDVRIFNDGWKNSIRLCRLKDIKNRFEVEPVYSTLDKLELSLNVLLNA